MAIRVEIVAADTVVKRVAVANDRRLDLNVQDGERRTVNSLAADEGIPLVTGVDGTSQVVQTVHAALVVDITKISDQI